MLVLLIIFMVTAPMMQSGIGVNLPQAETESAPGRGGADDQRLPGQVHPRRRAPSSTSTSWNGGSREHFAGKTKKIVYIKADEGLSYGYIVNIMDIAKKAGVETIGLVTEPVEKNGKKKR